MGADRWDEQVGSVADEAAKLLESLRRSAETPGADADAHGPGAPHEGEDPASASEREHTAPASGAHDPFCTWCPLCRTAEVMRSLSPETITRLADLATLAATVLADFASTRTTADASDAGRADPERRPAPRPSPSRHIPVRDDDDPQEVPRG